MGQKYRMAADAEGRPTAKKDQPVLTAAQAPAFSTHARQITRASLMSPLGQDFDLVAWGMIFAPDLDTQPRRQQLADTSRGAAIIWSASALEIFETAEYRLRRSLLSFEVSSIKLPRDLSGIPETG